jgi:hypothetical protein
MITLRINPSLFRFFFSFSLYSFPLSSNSWRLSMLTNEALSMQEGERKREGEKERGRERDTGGF